MIIFVFNTIKQLPRLKTWFLCRLKLWRQNIQLCFKYLNLFELCSSSVRLKIVFFVIGSLR